MSHFSLAIMKAFERYDVGFHCLLHINCYHHIYSFPNPGLASYLCLWPPFCSDIAVAKGWVGLTGHLVPQGSTGLWDVSGSRLINHLILMVVEVHGSTTSPLPSNRLSTLQGMLLLIASEHITLTTTRQAHFSVPSNKIWHALHVTVSG